MLRFAFFKLKRLCEYRSLDHSLRFYYSAMPRVIFTPAGMSDDLLNRLAQDPVVVGIIHSVPDPVVNVLVCLDGLPRGQRNLRQGQSDGMDRMLTSFMHKMQKAVSVQLFSFEANQSECEMQLRSAHIFWQAGSGGGSTSYIVEAIEQNQNGWKIVQDRVLDNELVYVGVCIGAMMAGSCYFGHSSAAVKGCMYQFFGTEVSVVYDNDLPFWEDDAILHMTGGVAIAIECTDVTAASAIIVSKNRRSAHLEKHGRIQVKLQRTVESLAKNWEVYKLYQPNGQVGLCWWKLDGTTRFWCDSSAWSVG